MFTVRLLVFEPLKQKNADRKMAKLGLWHNQILFTNTKLFKIGYISEDKCSFCNSEPEALHHLLFHCGLVTPFWKDLEYFFFLLTRKFVHLTLQDVMIGIIHANYPLLNYLILVAKSYIWDCRRNLPPKGKN